MFIKLENTWKIFSTTFPFSDGSQSNHQITNGWSLIRQEMPKLLPIKPMISDSQQNQSSQNGKDSPDLDTSVSKLRLVRPWENGKSPRKKSEEDNSSIEDTTEILEDEHMQEYVPLKKRRMIMYELDSKYSGVNFQNCH